MPLVCRQSRLKTQFSSMHPKKIQWPFFATFLSQLIAQIFICAFATSMASVYAEETLLRLTPVQVKSLGIDVKLGVPANGMRHTGFPGVVVLPHDQMRLLSAPFPALIENIYGAPGFPVKKGQWLLRLSAPQALELRRDREQAVAAHLLAQQSLKRDELLFAEGIIAESRLQTTRATATQASALLAERQDALKSAGLVDLGSGLFELRASMDGVILDQRVQVGQRVEASELLGKIGRLNTLWIDFQVPASLAGQVKIGQKIGIPALQIQGRLIAVGRAVDTSQSVLLRARIEEGGEYLAPGQSVEVTITTHESGSKSGVIAGGGTRLPAAALVRHQGGHFVFSQVSSSENQLVFQAQAVQLLGQSGEEVLVSPLVTAKQGASSISLALPIVVRGTSGLKAIWAGVGRE